jgi:hypothetical protein
MREMQKAHLQRWQLIGLRPMQDALVRRLVMQECDLLEDTSAPLSIEWSTRERFNTQNDWMQPEAVDVLIADVDRVSEMMKCSVGEPKRLPVSTSNPTCLRLLWSGLDGSYHDQVWASQWFAQGAIIDVVTLQSWVRIALQRGNRIPKPPHPWLRNVEIPGT